MSHGGGKGLTVGYVVSMATGLHSFVFREIRELTALGVAVRLFPTQVGRGPYMPRPGWPVRRPTPLGFVLANSRLLSRRLREYATALREALKLGAVIDFALAVFFADQVERSGVDLIHCHFGDHKLFIGHFVGRLTGRPVTVTIHAYELYNNPNPRMFRRALQTVAAVVTVSEYNRKILEQDYGVPTGRIHVIPMFTDVPEPLTSPARSGDRVIILTVARLVEKKGHGALIRALARLPVNYEAWVAGGGPLDVRAMSAAAGVGDRVKVLGCLSDKQLQETYRAATIFCLPSETTQEGDREGIPVALMEAMAHGLPVVATRHAGIPELVEATLVEERDVEGLAAAIARLGRNPALRERQGRRNREIVESRFSRRNVFQLKQLFECVAHDST